MQDRAAPLHSPRRRRRAGRSFLPEQASVPPPVRPAARGLSWRDVLAAVAFSLAALIAVSAGLDYCARPGAFCQSPQDLAGESMTAAPPSVAQASVPEPVEPERPVLAHAFAPLPLSFETRTTRNFVLPPGRSMLDMATEAGRIALDDLTLIAVVQQNGVRHALVRLPDGRIARLQQGDLLEGGTVAAIGEDALYLLDDNQRPRALVLGG
ncbi:hypothetical protein [Natronohydrobacter thiooxidans]|uniref:hypothetical protein n=1 Tax=Natronohydrobacter thiooxidans TaxID=87172 RepID=UPI0008FF2C0F|nr:hypothetical protein [Natronohydrobacter thiooxidans]